MWPSSPKAHSQAALLLSSRSSTTREYVGWKVGSEWQDSYNLQVLVEGPSDKPELAVPRQAAPLSALSLTGIVIENLPRAVGPAALKKKWAAAEVDSKWTQSSYAKKLEKASRRKQLSDFERFKVMRLRKQVCWSHESCWIWI